MKNTNDGCGSQRHHMDRTVCWWGCRWGKASEEVHLLVQWAMAQSGRGGGSSYSDRDDDDAQWRHLRSSWTASCGALAPHRRVTRSRGGSNDYTLRFDAFWSIETKHLSGLEEGSIRELCGLEEAQIRVVFMGCLAEPMGRTAPSPSWHVWPCHWRSNQFYKWKRKHGILVSSNISEFAYLIVYL
jgi:hypothetical protein